jgi:hypothetical protein
MNKIYTQIREKNERLYDEKDYTYYYRKCKNNFDKKFAQSLIS